MPTEVVINEDDDEFHEKHPDKSGETFCGIEFNQSDVARYASFGASYADFARRTVQTEEDKDFCQECHDAADEWAEENA